VPMPRPMLPAPTIVTFILATSSLRRRREVLRRGESWRHLKA
jgi:hypothetical protein